MTALSVLETDAKISASESSESEPESDDTDVVLTWIDTLALVSRMIGVTWLLEAEELVELKDPEEF